MQAKKSAFGWIFAFAGQKRSGELKNILVERVDSMEPTLAHVIPEMSSNAVVVLATLLYLFTLDWRMALASLATLPMGLVFFMLMMLGYEKNYARTVAATNALNDTAVEYIGGIEVIKVFGKAKSSYEKFVAAARECAQSYIDWMNKSNFHFTFAMNIMPATLLTVLPIGCALMKAGTLSSEKFVLIVILSMGLVTPIIGCMKFTDDLAKVGTVISQVTDILTAPELPRPEADTQTPQGSTVQLHDVHFGYGEAEVLHGVSLTFREGTVNALVGPSGSGKSTIAKLIASFWGVGSGSITVGGADIRNISAEHYHKLVAYVSQDNFLFAGTVRENIRIGRPEATDAQVEQAARDCGCDDFIMGLEQGFDTQVGSGGGHLSGGERQRISPFFTLQLTVCTTIKWLHNDREVHNMVIEHLRANHIENPIGFLMNSLSLSWIVTQAKGTRTAKASVRIALDEAMDKTVFDSGERPDLCSTDYAPAFSPEPGTRYYWQVRVWDDAGDAGESSVAFFETAAELKSAQ